MKIEEKDRDKKRTQLRRRDQAFIAAALATGARAQEILMLHTGNFEVEKDKVKVSGMPLLKRYKKEKTPISQPDQPLGELAKQFDWKCARYDMDFLLVYRLCTHEGL